MDKKTRNKQFTVITIDKDLITPKNCANGICSVLFGATFEVHKDIITDNLERLTIYSLMYIYLRNLYKLGRYTDIFNWVNESMKDDDLRKDWWFETQLLKLKHEGLITDEDTPKDNKIKPRI